MYRTLRSEEIIRTAKRLHDRIVDRFPESSLARVADELHGLTREAQARCREISKANLPLRIAVFLLFGLGIAGLVLVVSHVRITEGVWNVENFLESMEAFLGIVVFLGAGGFFLISVEMRWKRTRALKAINELRALAHIVDMHQLTKDPEVMLTQVKPTPASPERSMSPVELSRYLDYCSEMLSIISKIGAVYVQSCPDPETLRSVDEIDDLTMGLSQKVWQKIMILGRYVGAQRP